MALVLCTGVDPSVVRTRQLILERRAGTWWYPLWTSTA